MRAVNLLPSDLRSAAKAPAPVNPAPEDGGGSGAYIALGALALCVFALAGYILTTNTIKQRESDLAALDTRSQAVLAETSRLKPYADFQSLATARIATVRDLASQRFDWETSLRDLSRALPEDVSIKQLVGSVSSQAGGGGTLRGAIDAPAIELAGCASGQHGVARMMARLRAVGGVTRVSLESSVKTESTNDPSAVGAPTEGCEGKGKGDPADFNVVVFFERSTGASADPSAPAQPTAATPGAGTTQAGATATPAASGSAPTTEQAPSTPAPTSAEAE